MALLMNGFRPTSLTGNKFKISTIRSFYFGRVNLLLCFFFYFYLPNEVSLTGKLASL